MWIFPKNVIYTVNACSQYTPHTPGIPSNETVHKTMEAAYTNTQRTSPNTVTQVTKCNTLCVILPICHNAAIVQVRKIITSTDIITVTITTTSNCNHPTCQSWN